MLGIPAIWRQALWLVPMVAFFFPSYGVEEPYSSQQFVDPNEIHLTPNSMPSSTEITQGGPEFFSAPIIQDIIIKGNNALSSDAILAKIPYRVGQRFRALSATKVIRTLYGLGYFKPTIRVHIIPLDNEHIILEITVEEKDIVDEFCFVGNDHAKVDEIDKKVHYTEIKALEQDDLERLNEQIKQLYLSKDYHDITINSEIIPTAPGHAQVQFTITEGKPVMVREVRFTGNTCVSSKLLRSLIFTREQWLFGFLSKAGSFQPEALEYDKYVIENYYRNRGYLHAHVDDVLVERDPKSPKHFIVTFKITEGDIYHIRSVTAEGNNLLTSEQMLRYIPIQPGDLFSGDKFREAIDQLRLVYGEYGYIFAETNYGIEPHEQDKTMSVNFSSILGEPVTCGRITISGNQKTRDKVIRRQITINEGDLLTSRALDASKEHIERLGFFDQQNGVNWKVNRIDDKRADLDLAVKEIKTGKFLVNFSTGGDPKNISSPTTSFKVDVTLRDTNFLGTSLKYALTGTFSTQDIEVGVNVTQPWLFNRPIVGGFDVYHRKLTYDDFRRVNNSPREHTTGGDITLGYTTPQFGEISFLFDLGFEHIRYDNLTAQLNGSRSNLNTLWQDILNSRFQSGNALDIGTRALQDRRNNPAFPSRGYLWTSAAKIGAPVSPQGSFGFFKWDVDAHWYAPLINETDLIFHLHGHFGIVGELGNFPIPYRELYHIGGPATVRGFLFGQIGPTLFGDSLGAKKALWINAELVFPLTKDFNLVGLIFYDGGAGWDTPQVGLIQKNQDLVAAFRGNSFHFRQAIGLGLKMRSPIPISVAVGFKLDRLRNEPLSEVLFSSAVDF